MEGDRSIYQYLLNGIIAGSIYALMAVGFAVVYRTVRFFHFAHGVVYAVGAYVAYTIVKSLQAPPIVGFLVAALAAGVVGVLIDRLVYRPLRKRKASNLIYLIASFGVFILIQNILQIIFGAQILSIRTGPVKVGHEFLGAIITDIQITILAVGVVLFLLLWLFLQRTKIGTAMRAVADDPLGADIVGINPERIIIMAFLIGSMLAGAAGMMVSYETNLEPTMGFNAILKGIVAAIIGGVGSIPGAVLGGFLLGVVENLGIWQISAGWKDTIAFALLIVFLLARPQGIMGRGITGERV